MHLSYLPFSFLPLFAIAQSQLPLRVTVGENTRLLELHRKLTSIASVTGTEPTVTKYLSDYLEKHDFVVHLQGVTSSENATRANLFAYPTGCSANTPVLLTSHLDTVPPFYPYESSNGTIHGRGSVDAKASVATQIIALRNLLEAEKIERCSTALLFVVGEERGGDGMRAFSKTQLEWDAVIFGEPTENRLVAGHKGVGLFYVKATGNSGHSGYPWLAVSANELLARALGAIMDVAEGTDREGRKLPYSEKYGNTTINLGMIGGGVAPNVMAETAQAEFAIRIAGGSYADAKKVIEATVHTATKGMVDRAHKEGKNANVTVGWSNEGYGPVDLNYDVNVWGDENEDDPFTVNFGTDVPNLEGSHKRYLYGPGSILVAHSDHEAIKVEDLVKGVEGYERLLTGVLRKLNTK